MSTPKPREPKKRTLCGPKGYCFPMDERVQDSHSKGLVVWDFMNIDTGKPSGSLVGYKAKATDRGLALNYCPWCGSEYRAWNPILNRQARSGKGRK